MAHEIQKNMINFLDNLPVKFEWISHPKFCSDCTRCDNCQYYIGVSAMARVDGVQGNGFAVANYCKNYDGK